MAIIGESIHKPDREQKPHISVIMAIHYHQNIYGPKLGKDVCRESCLPGASTNERDNVFKTYNGSTITESSYSSLREKRPEKFKSNSKGFSEEVVNT